jgi:hypothetical protein
MVGAQSAYHTSARSVSRTCMIPYALMGRCTLRCANSPPTRERKVELQFKMSRSSSTVTWIYHLDIPLAFERLGEFIESSCIPRHCIATSLVTQR